MVLVTLDSRFRGNDKSFGEFGDKPFRGNDKSFGEFGDKPFRGIDKSFGEFGDKPLRGNDSLGSGILLWGFRRLLFMGGLIAVYE